LVREIRFSFYHFPKIITERFAVSGQISGELDLSGVRKIGKRQLTDLPKNGKLQLHIWA
jgi:hypothetical protein